jgi:hypothetical protein
LIHLFEIINQRIFQQNEAKLIQFKTTVYYNDNSTITLNGFDHLVHFNEPLPLVSEAIHLTWQYLIQFKDKSTFEMQEINVSFKTPSRNSFTIDDEYEYSPYASLVHIRINHTARTWGADIEGLFIKTH